MTSFHFGLDTLSGILITQPSFDFLRISFWVLHCYQRSLLWLSFIPENDYYLTQSGHNGPHSHTVRTYKSVLKLYLGFISTFLPEFVQINVEPPQTNVEGQTPLLNKLN